MKNTLFAALLLLLASDAFAKWEHLTSTDILDAYLESAKIRKEGSFIKYWALYSYNEVQVIGTHKYRSRAILRQLDCSSDKSRVLSSVFYSGVMGGGESVQITTPDDWADIVPGTIGENFSNKICSKNSN